QTSPTPSPSCDPLQNWFYDAASRSCCYRCPPGSVRRKACTRDPADCLLCGPEEFVDAEALEPRCDACVSCAEPDLVEQKPCTPTSDRVCQCRPGLFCATALKNSCARCRRHTACPSGFGVTVLGTSTSDVTCGECPPGTFSNQDSSTDACKPHTNCTELNKAVLSQGNATHDRVCLEQLPTPLASGTLSMGSSSETGNFGRRWFEQNPVTAAGVLSSATTTADPGSTPEQRAPAGTVPTLAAGEAAAGGLALWAALLAVTGLLVVLLLLWKWKVCKKRILVLTGKCKCLKLSPLPFVRQIALAADGGLDEKELIDRTNNNLVPGTSRGGRPSVSLAEVTQSNGNGPDCPLDPRVRDHANNRIDKIYIMNADTVIVGSVSAPGGRGCAASGCESNADPRESPEEELAVRYPEQETETSPGNEVTVPVEEEGKEFHHPTAATGE
ncbi:TNR8 factor, partial [Trogon melanurus]|nr:TNR8 factor [Trogon melanurus]